MSNPLNQQVQVILGKHKAVAAAISSTTGLLLLLLAAGVLHGTAQSVVELVVGAATALGVTGAVYVTPTTAKLTGPTTLVTPGPGDVAAL